MDIESLPAEVLESVSSLTAANVRGDLKRLFRDPAKDDRSLETLDLWAARIMDRPLPFRSSALGYLVPNPAIASDLLRMHPDHLGLALVCSYSVSGHVREAAVRHLSLLGASGLPILFVRSRDWIPQVASPARESALELIARASEQDLRRTLDTVAANNWTGALVELLGDEIRQRVGLLHSIRKAGAPRTREHLLYRRWFGTDEDPLLVCVGACQDRDPRVAESALLALQSLGRSLADEFVRRLAQAHSRTVRLYAMSQAGERGDTQALRWGVDDRSWHVRARARNELARLENVDFLDHYRQRLPECTAIAGFGELAQDSEVGLLLPFLDHPMAAQRRETVKVVRARRLHVHGPLLVPLLHDPSIKVVREAVKALKELAVPLEPIFVEGLVAGAPERFRRTYAQTLSVLPRWEQFLVALRLIVNAKLDSHILADWMFGFAHDRLGPSRAQLEEAEHLFDQASPQIDQFVALRLKLELRYWATHCHDQV